MSHSIELFKIYDYYFNFTTVYSEIDPNREAKRDGSFD